MAKQSRILYLIGFLICFLFGCDSRDVHFDFCCPQKPLSIPNIQKEAKKNQHRKAMQIEKDRSHQRDPFRPPQSASIIRKENEQELQRLREQKSLLERVPLDELRLTAIAHQGYRKVAIVEDKKGNGFLVKIGTHVGENKGWVRAILSDRIIIREEGRGCRRMISEIALLIKSSDNRSKKGPKIFQVNNRKIKINENGNIIDLIPITLTKNRSH